MEKINNRLGRKKPFLSDIKKHKGLILMALPGFILMLMFAYMPMCGLLAAFKDYDFSLGLLGSKWVGLKNFELLLASKEITFRIVRNTVL